MKNLILLIIITLTLISCNNEEEGVVQKTVQEKIEQICDCSKTQYYFQQKDESIILVDIIVTPNFSTDCILDGTSETEDKIFNNKLYRTVSTITCIQK